MNEIETPFIASMSDRIRAARRHQLVIQWAWVATVAAAIGWGSFIAVLILKP